MDPLFFNLSSMSDLQLTLAEERLRLGLPFEQHPGPLLDATMALGPDLEATHPLAEGSGGPIGVRQGQDTGAGGSDDVYLNQMAIVGWNPNMTAFPLRDRPEPLGLFEVSLADAMVCALVPLTCCLCLRLLLHRELKEIPPPRYVLVSF